MSKKNIQGVSVNLKLPIYRQHPDSVDCVPFSLKAVAEFYGRKFSKEQARKICETHRGLGSYPEKYIPNAKEMGLKFVRVSYTYRSLSNSLRQGHPVSVTYRVDSGRSIFSHFAMVTGLRKEAGGRPMVTLSDTYFGKTEMPLELLQTLMRQAAQMRGIQISCKKIINLG